MSFQPTSCLPPKQLFFSKYIQPWIDEDCPSFDFGTGLFGAEKKGQAELYCKQYGEEPCLAGRQFVEWIFEYLAPNCKMEWNYEDGDEIKVKKEKVVVARIQGPIKEILQSERLALNLLSRCSGCASVSRKFFKLKEKHGWKGEIAATRKTTPGFRLVEKFGTICGGCTPHRYNVSQMCMIKDNHIDAMGGDIFKTVQAIKKRAGHSIMIEVECRTLEDARQASKAGAHVIMLDNMGPDQFKKDARLLKKDYPHVVVEGSGGLNYDTIHEYFDESVDVLSLSSMVQGYSCIDFSMKIVKNL